MASGSKQIFPGGKKNKKNKWRQNGESSGAQIEVDPDTDKPSTAWERLKEHHVQHQLPTDMYLNTPRSEDSLRFVCLSDTHCTIENSHKEFHKRIPDGDVLIHCGDFSMGGAPSEIIAFDSFMARLPHPVKLVIAGNHELTFEQDGFHYQPTLVRAQLGLPVKSPHTSVREGCINLLQHFVYLEDESIEICGLKIYGTPWVPTFGTWGFSVSRGERLLERWNDIPSDTDILVTHGPPCGYGDMAKGDKHAGCVELLNTVVQRVKPKFHVFGHIHTGYGMWTNKVTTFINCAVCSNRYHPDHDPIVFDVPLLKGFTRSHFENLTTDSLREAREKLQAEADAKDFSSEVTSDSNENHLGIGRAKETGKARDSEEQYMIDSGHLSTNKLFSNGFVDKTDLLKDIRAVQSKNANAERSEEEIADKTQLLKDICAVRSKNATVENPGEGIVDKTQLSKDVQADVHSEGARNKDVEYPTTFSNTNVEVKGAKKSEETDEADVDKPNLKNVRAFWARKETTVLERKVKFEHKIPEIPSAERLKVADREDECAVDKARTREDEDCDSERSYTERCESKKDR